MGRKARKAFRELKRSVLQGDAKYEAPEDVTFITYSTYKHATLVEKCYAQHGIEPVVLCRKFKGKWTWWRKIGPVRNYLSEVKTRLVVATDANDILIANDLSRIPEFFDSFKAKMVFCSTPANWPRDNQCAAFEDGVYEGPDKHLSAGGYVAETEYLRDSLDEIYRGRKRRWCRHGGRFDDQRAWRRMQMKYYPEIRVDDKALLFARANRLIA